jgi:formate dehydrogenase gamma subunit
LAIPFLLCYTSALVLVVYYNPDPQRPYREIVSWFHRLSGVSLFLLPLWAAFKARGDFRLHFYNIRQAWIWSLQDFRWLALMGLAAVSSRVRLPEQGKFNAAEKLNFMVLMSTYPLYILTGLAIWFSHGAFLAWVVHVGMAILATPLVGGHMFMATLNPSTRKGLEGMISGFVDRQWAKHHYRRWYREHFEGSTKPSLSTRHTQEMSAAAACDACEQDYPIPSPQALMRVILHNEPLRCPRCHAEMRRINTNIEPETFHSLLLSLHREPAGPPSPHRQPRHEPETLPL